MTNTYIVEIVARFIEPNPIVYTQLATVNRDFYTVFTSDRLWASLDAYGLKTGIFEHFLEKRFENEQLLMYFWNISGSCEKFHFNIERISNKYAQLGYYVKRAPLINPTDRQLLYKVLKIDPYLYEYCEELHYDKELAVYICGLCPSMLGYVSTEHYDDQEFCRQVMQVMLPPSPEQYFAQPFGWISPNREIVEYAMKFYPPVILYAYEPTDTEFIDLVPDRATFCEAIKGHATYLYMFPNFLDDKEVCLAALYPIQPEFTGDLHIVDQWDDPEIVLAALRLGGRNIVAATPKLRGDKDIALACIESLSSSDSHFLRFLDTELGNDPDIIALILEKQLFSSMSDTCTFCSQEQLEILLDTRDWVKDRIKIWPGVWNMASKRLQNDRELFFLAFESSEIYKNAPPGLVCKYEFRPDCLSTKFHTDKDVAEVLKKIGFLYLIPESIIGREAHLEQIAHFGLSGYPYPCDDLEMAQAAISKNAGEICRVSKRLKQCPELYKCIENPYSALYLWDDEETSSSIAAALGPKPEWNSITRENAILIEPYQYDYLPDSVLDLEFAIEAVRRHPCAFQYLQDYLQDIKEVQEAINLKKK